MMRSTPAAHRHTAAAPAAHRPVVVSLHRAEGVSGINAWGARMARLGPPHARWHMLVVGEGLTRERAAGAAGGAPEWSMATWRRGASAVEQVRAVREAIREAGAEVVAPNDVAHGYIGAGLEHHRGVRCAAVCHACSGVDEDFFARVGRLADAWVAVSRRGRERLGPVMGREGAGVIPCGVCVPARATPVSAGPGPLRLLYAGRLDQHCKRVLDLPVLCAALDALGVDWRLTVAGDGSARAELAAGLARFGERASMLGLAPAAEMAGLYERADCLVLLSAFEGWPVTVIEALAAGRPVAITTGCGGALDVVRDGVEGLVVPTGDISAMARRLAGLDRCSLARMGVAAHAAARAGLDLRTQAGAYDGVVRSLAAGAARGTGGAEVAARWGAILGAFTAIEAPAPMGELLALLLGWLGEIGAPPVAADLGGGVAELLARTHGAGARIGGIRGAAGGRWMGWPVVAGEGPVIVAGADSPWRAAGPVLPLSVPAWPNFSSGCFLRALARLRGAGIGRVALYGAGRHTRRLSAALAVSPEVVGIVDDRAGAGVAERMWGYPVVSPREFTRLGAQAVVVSSDEHQEVMSARAAAWAGGAPVVRLYSAEGYAA
jgi:glycosyltransferase involved in cell wall biosynthesis